MAVAGRVMAVERENREWDPALVASSFPCATFVMAAMNRRIDELRRSIMSRSAIVCRLSFGL